FSLDQTLRLITPDCEVIGLHNSTQGALCSALLAIDSLVDDEPLVICNGDQVIDADLGEIVSLFIDDDADAGVITFESVHPRWSYVELGDHGQVLQAAEKRVISRNAIAGFYFFASGKLFV